MTLKKVTAAFIWIALIGVVAYEFGFSALGGGSRALVPLNCRDVRVKLNFKDSSVFSQNTGHINFPKNGHTLETREGLAVWKGAVEWNSCNHGDGCGDPHQQGGLGSGYTNFDFVWQGSMPGGYTPYFRNLVESVNNPRIFSGPTVIAECWWIGGGPLWNIRFNDQAHVFWAAQNVNGCPSHAYDVQAIAAHELGHAAGIHGHASATSDTMYFSTYGGSSCVNKRSISNNDRAMLVNAGYGTLLSQSKPYITGVKSLTYRVPYGIIWPGDEIIITGRNFLQGPNNEVWFTRLDNHTAGMGRVPVKVQNLSSYHNGTQIRVTVPMGARSCEFHVAVVRNGQSGPYYNHDLSNSWPMTQACNPAYHLSSSTDILSLSQTSFDCYYPRPGAPPTLTITGRNFNDAAFIHIGGQQPIPIPPASIISDTQIDFSWPRSIVDDNKVFVYIVNNAGEAGVAKVVNIVPFSTPWINGADTAKCTTTIDLDMGGNYSDSDTKHIVYYSHDSTPSPPLSIGGNYQFLYHLFTSPVINSGNNYSYRYPLYVPQIASPTDFYFQSVEFDDVGQVPTGRYTNVYTLHVIP